MGLQFDHPWALTLLLPCTCFILWMLAKTPRLTGGRKIASIAVRSVILLLLVALVSGLTPYVRMEQRDVVFAADRSASLNSDDRMADWIGDAIASKENDDRAAVVSFGLNASVDRALSKEGEQSFSLRTNVNKSFSNAAGAIQLGAGLLERGGRIVLLSDGEENVGDLLRQGKRLKELGIAVDVVSVPKKQLNDASIDSLEVPASLKSGEKFSFEIKVTSSFAGQAELRLYEDETEKVRETVALERGENRFALESVAIDTGLHRYRAEIYAADDQRAENNTAFAFSRVDGPPRVLVIEGEPESSGNITASLQASLIPFDVIAPEQLPVELADYAKYDSLVLNNVPATRIAEAPMRNLGAAVSDYGIGLVMVGGKESYGLGGYFKTPVEKALPVYMDLKGKRQMPSLGLILVIDKSGSMADGKLELAKEAALRTVELMRDQDTVGVVAFDGSPWWVMEPTKLTERESVVSAIQGIQPNGGTEIYEAVNAALARMLDVDAQRKHIILLTDGQSSSNPGYSNLTSTMVDNDITMSTVAVGDGADTVLLERLANDAKGRFYFSNDQSTLPAIFSRETTLMSRTYIVENRFIPAIGQAGNWASSFSEGIPAVDAYVATTAKETAETVLLTPMGDPLLARWQYGSGRTVAWTSDLTGKWAKDWIGWSKLPDLFTQWLKWTFPQFSGSPYDVQADWTGGEAKLRIRETSSGSGGTANLSAIVTDEQGNRADITPIPVAPGEYTGSVPIAGPGVYLTQIGSGNGQNGSVAGFVVPYSPEYRLTDGGGADKLAKLADLTGGRVIDPSRPEDAFQGALTVRRNLHDVTRSLLVAAILLWIVDIAIRRISVPWRRFTTRIINIINYREKTKTKAAEPIAAISRLQQRKQRTGEFYAGNDPIRSEKAHIAEKPVVTKAQTPTSVDPSNSPISQPMPSSNSINRLLEAKKRSNRRE
ncbi:VWA domain-containing protein [Cohnella faecalis]|uniref:VWA domain-containing protein n=1 Tax=Cohnella faecalis TaxID=2315694 RepID=A0A398CNC1_9BACL|nr:VWA domain-containing protein [Cohnella faecalis]RIE04856.1 VWA domain-containing protein [Cohnella faecalis]